MNNIKEKLQTILKKIEGNTINAWEDALEESKEVVILEDFDKNDDQSSPFSEPLHEELITKYNGWYEDLIELMKSL